MARRPLRGGSHAETGLAAAGGGAGHDDSQRGARALWEPHTLQLTASSFAWRGTHTRDTDRPGGQPLSLTLHTQQQGHIHLATLQQWPGYERTGRPGVATTRSVGGRVRGGGTLWALQGAGEQQRRGRRQRQRRQQQQAANGPAASAIAPASQAGVLRRTVARGEPDTTMATTAKRGRLRATAASYVLVRGVLKTSTQRLPRDMRVHYAPGCSRRGLAWHRR